MFEFILCKIPFGLRVEVSPSYSVRYRVNTEKMRLFRHDSKIKSPDSVLYLYLCKQCAADFKVTWICCIGIESRFNWHVITNDRGYFANSLWKLHSCMTQRSLESKRQIMLVRHHYTLTIVSISALDDQTTSEGCFFAKDLTKQLLSRLLLFVLPRHWSTNRASPLPSFTQHCPYFSFSYFYLPPTARLPD